MMMLFLDSPFDYIPSRIIRLQLKIDESICISPCLVIWLVVRKIIAGIHYLFNSGASSSPCYSRGSQHLENSLTQITNITILFDFSYIWGVFWRYRQIENCWGVRRIKNLNCKLKTKQQQQEECWNKLCFITEHIE